MCVVERRDLRRLQHRLLPAGAGLDEREPFLPDLMFIAQHDLPTGLVQLAPVSIERLEAHGVFPLEESNKVLGHVGRTCLEQLMMGQLGLDEQPAHSPHLEAGTCLGEGRGRLHPDPIWSSAAS